MMKDSCVLRGEGAGPVSLYICNTIRNLCSITEGLLCNTALLTTPPSVNTTPSYWTLSQTTDRLNDSHESSDKPAGIGTSDTYQKI